MVAGDAVQEAVRSTGVGGHVAPDRAHLLTRRIRREVKSERTKVLRQIEVDDTGLDPGHAVVDVDLEDPVHLRQRDDDRRPERDGSSRESGAGSPGHDPSTVALGDPHDRLDLSRRGRESTPVHMRHRRRSRRRARRGRARLRRLGRAPGSARRRGPGEADLPRPRRPRRSVRASPDRPTPGQLAVGITGPACWSVDKDDGPARRHTAPRLGMTSVSLLDGGTCRALLPEAVQDRLGVSRRLALTAEHERRRLPGTRVRRDPGPWAGTPGPRRFAGPRRPPCGPSSRAPRLAATMP